MPSELLKTANLAMRIVLFTLRCVVGLFAAIGFMVVVGSVAAILWWRQIAPWEATRQTPDITVLTLDLGAGVVEAPSSSPLEQASQGDAVVLSEALLGLEAAAGDPRVKGLFTRVGRGEVGLAQVQELREAIARFRTQGKFTIAFAESFSDAGKGMLHYYLASASEKVWLQPSGELDLTGFHLESPFLRSALNDLGIQPQLGQREDYKGATTIFTDTSLPEPQRQNLQQLVRSWLSQVIRDVGADRGLPGRELREIVDLGPFFAGDAQKQGLVDKLGYWDQASKLALDLAGEGAEFLSVSEYSNNRDAPPDEAPTIAVVFGLGAISLGEGEGEPVFERLIMDADTVSTAIADAVEDDRVAAIVFRIDSPGGSYIASDVIWREVRRAREVGKPLIVSMGNIAASGGYFVAAPAYRIVSQPGTVTGSIGVAGGKFVLSELWDRIGVHWDGVQAGAHADMWSANQPFSPDGWAWLNSTLDRTYDDFIDKVADGRNMSADRVRRAAKGQVWSGEDAVQRGLVDELGGFHRAVQIARVAAGIRPDKPVRLETFPEPRDPIQAVLRALFAGEFDLSKVSAATRYFTRLARALTPITDAIEAATVGESSSSLKAPLPAAGF